MLKRLPVLLLFCFAFAVQLSAQTADLPFRMSIRASGTVPHPLSNKAFRRSFTGIYDVGASVNFQVIKGFVAGLAYEHNLWKTPDNKIPGLNTYSQSHNGGIRVGYDRAIGETAVAYFGVSALIGRVNYYGISYRPDSTHVPLQTKYTYRSIVPDLGVFFYTEGNFAIGVHASVVFTNFQFDPDKLYLDQHKAYIASDYDGNVSHLNVGFCVVYSFWNTRKSTN